MWKLMKMLIGIGLWPLAWAVSVSAYTLYETSLETGLGGGWSVWALPIGFVLWAVIFFLLPRPFRTYVLGHELTHALWAMLMGGRVGQLRVGRSGGHVELSKSNFLITLAPYFFPFYAVLVIAAYYLAGIRFDMQSFQTWWLGMVGLAWSFHLTFTVQMLSQRQPDVEEHGMIFSLTVIYIMNVLVIALLMILLGEPRLLLFGDLLGRETAASYAYTVHAAEQAWAWCVRFAAGFR